MTPRALVRVGAMTDSPSTQREDFLDAAARCRRDVWRVGTVAVLCSALLLAVLAALLTPLTFVLLTLASDVANLVWSVPEPISATRQWVRTFPKEQRAFPAAMTLIGVPFALTVAAMVLAYVRIGRALALSPPFSGVFDTDDVGVAATRKPDGANLAEQRIVNTVEEMAIAAGLPAPTVRMVEGGMNAAIVGLDEQHMLVLAGSGLAELSRDELQGTAAHLLASAANGDLGVGREIVRLLVLVTIFRASGRVFEPGGPTRAARLCLTLLFPTRARCRDLVSLLREPPSPPITPGPSTGRSRSTKLTAREWAAMPLAGPLGIASVLGDLLLDFLVLPLIALAWRSRKFMADATAVRLTRYPDALAGALKQIDGAPGTGIPPWINHLAVVDRLVLADKLVTPAERISASLAAAEARSSELFRSTMVSIFPPIHRRLEDLVRMGAAADATAKTSANNPGVSPVVWVLVAPLMLLVVGLLPVLAILLGIASLMTSGVFTVLPGMVVHVLARLAMP